MGDCSIKYMGTGETFAWPVTFPFEGYGLIVSAINQGGREVLWKEGEDYLTKGSSVLCYLEAGEILHIQRGAPLARKTAASPVAAAEPLLCASAIRREAAPAFDESGSRAATLDDIEALEQKLLARLAEAPATSRAEDAEASARDRISAAGDEATAKIATQAETAIQAVAEQIQAACEAVYHRCHLEADRAIQAAAKVTHLIGRPGVGSVKSEGEIPGSAPGILIVNPHLTHSPTPFMGVWPVADICQIQWDGFFFFGHPYEGAIKPPPPWGRPGPRPGEGKGDGDDWIPCDHPHFPPPCPCHKPPDRP